MDENNVDVAVMWTLTGLSVVVMMVRLVMRWSRARRFELGDYFTMAAISAVLLRSSVESVAILWGTNQITAKAWATLDLTPEVIYQREVGSQMTMVNRLFYTV